MSSVNTTKRGLRAEAALASASPVLKNIAAGLSLSPAAQGVLTTLPVVCLGLAAPLAPRISRRIGPERIIFAFLIVLAICKPPCFSCTAN